jgi:hypothetical protein
MGVNQPEKQEPKTILQAWLMPDNTIRLTIYSNHLPMLTYVSKLLEVEIDKKIIDDKIKAQMGGNGGIVIPSKHGILDFMRGARNPHGG